MKVTRPTSAGIMPTSICRNDRNGNAALETSSPHELLQQLARLGPGDRQAGIVHRRAAACHAVLGQMPLEPAQVIALGRQRADEQELVVGVAADGEIADQLAALVEHRRQREPADRRHAVGHDLIEELRRARPLDLDLAVIGDLGHADGCRAPRGIPRRHARTRWSGGR